ncbi:hypothetical protein [Rhodoferax sp.]|uniref:hypothetical protein n=1 Tax=Rhodoferax sp. TaxID=50421 RepID=UPI00378492B5
MSLAYNFEDEPMRGLHSLGVTLLSQKGYRVDQTWALNWIRGFACRGALWLVSNTPMHKWADCRYRREQP